VRGVKYTIFITFLIFIFDYRKGFTPLILFFLSYNKAWIPIIVSQQMLIDIMPKDRTVGRLSRNCEKDKKWFKMIL
jgi:hypothetical protein